MTLLNHIGVFILISLILSLIWGFEVFKSNEVPTFLEIQLGSVTIFLILEVFYWTIQIFFLNYFNI
jgi:hypothetical protein